MIGGDPLGLEKSWEMSFGACSQAGSLFSPFSVTPSNTLSKSCAGALSSFRDKEIFAERIISFLLLQLLGGALFSVKVSVQSRDLKCSFESALCLSYRWSRFSRNPVGNK